MDQNEIRDLVSFVVNKNVHEFVFERKDTSVKIKRSAPVIVMQANPSPAPAAAPNAVKETPPAESLHLVKSSIVGIFRSAPGPDSSPLAKVGDTVRAGQPIGLVECVGLMTEIEADVSGEIVQQLAGNGQPVDYGRPLFEIRPLRKAA